jgi:hypothetical protein
MRPAFSSMQSRTVPRLTGKERPSCMKSDKTRKGVRTELLRLTKYDPRFSLELRSLLKMSPRRFSALIFSVLALY